MDRNLNNQQNVFSPEKKANISLTLGIISVCLLVISGLLDWFLEPYLEREKFFIIEELMNKFTSLMQLPIASIIALIGLILGIKDLKSPKKKFTKIGIGLCGFVLVWTLWLLGQLLVIRAGF